MSRKQIGRHLWLAQSVFHPFELQPPKVIFTYLRLGLPAYGMLLLFVPHSFSPEIFDAKSQWPWLFLSLAYNQSVSSFCVKFFQDRDHHAFSAMDLPFLALSVSHQPPCARHERRISALLATGVFIAIKSLSTEMIEYSFLLK